MNLAILRGVGSSKSCAQYWKSLLSERFEGASGVGDRTAQSRLAQGPSKASALINEQSAFCANEGQGAVKEDR